MNQINIKVRLSDGAIMPKRAHPTDAGADLFALTSRTDIDENIIIQPGESKMIDTGVAMQIPEGMVGLVFSRSGQGKIKVSLANSVGVIDSDYRGTIRVILVNDGDKPYCATTNAIAQLVIVPMFSAKFTNFDDEWFDTKRGTNGFGSTN